MIKKYINVFNQLKLNRRFSYTQEFTVQKEIRKQQKFRVSSLCAFGLVSSVLISNPFQQIIPISSIIQAQKINQDYKFLLYLNNTKQHEELNDKFSQDLNQKKLLKHSNNKIMLYYDQHNLRSIYQNIDLISNLNKYESLIQTKFATEDQLSKYKSNDIIKASEKDLEKFNEELKIIDTQIDEQLQDKNIFLKATFQNNRNKNDIDSERIFYGFLETKLIKNKISFMIVNQVHPDVAVIEYNFDLELDEQQSIDKESFKDIIGTTSTISIENLDKK